MMTYLGQIFVSYQCGHTLGRLVEERHGYIPTGYAHGPVPLYGSRRNCPACHTVERDARIEQALANSPYGG